MNEIVTPVMRVPSLLGEIASTSSEKPVSTGEQCVTQMDEATQQNAVLVNNIKPLAGIDCQQPCTNQPGSAVS